MKESTNATRVSDATRVSAADGGSGLPASLGAALRARRTQRAISVRALARQVGVSASLISQIETGKVNPSVGTLVSIATALDLSLDELFFDVEQEGSSAGRSSSRGPAPGPVLHKQDRLRLDLATGVHWYRLTPTTEHGVDFLFVVYDVDGESCPPDALMRHHGREHGLVLSGRLATTIGFDTYELEPGDSIVFNADVPHRLAAIGSEPATAVWVIIGRSGDDRRQLGD